VPRILLVDDDIAEISAVKRVLARAGHQPVLATNASDAMAAIGQAPPDLLVVGSTCENGEALAMAVRVASGEAGVAPMPTVVLGEAPGTPEGAAVVRRPLDPAQLTEEVAKGLQGVAPAEPPAPPRSTGPGGTAPWGVPVAKIATGKAPALRPPPAQAATKARTAAIIPPPPPPESPASARHHAPAAQPRPALSVDVTAALEPVDPRRPAGHPSTARGAQPTASAPQDPGARRAAAAEALRARAEELRRGAVTSTGRSPISEEVVDDELDALLEHVGEDDDAPSSGAAIATRPRPAPATRSPPPAPVRPAPAAKDAAAERRVAEARADADEGRRRAQESAEEGARRARAAEARAQTEAEARRKLEGELEALRRQMDEERRSAAEQLAGATAERARADEASARSDAEARRREEQEAELRRAMESARADMEALQRHKEGKARQRAEVEDELERLTEETVLRQGGPAVPVFPDSMAARSAEPVPSFDFPDEVAAATPGEEEARRRAQAERERRSAGVDGDDLAWSEPARTPPPAPAPEPEMIPVRAPPLPPPELRSGTLVEMPAPRLLALAWRAKLSGRLDFQGAAARSIHFEEGRIVGATSAEPSERLEEQALRLGLVTREQYRQVAPAAAALPSRRAALLLLERGYLKPTELTGLVRHRAAEIVFGLFADENGRFRWVGAEVPPEERVGLDRGTLALAVGGVRRRWLAPRIEPFLGGPSTLLAPAGAGAPPLAEMGLSADERRAVALADGLRTLDEIEAASPLDSLTTRQVLCALVLAGSLSVRVLGAGRTAGAAAAAIDLARVKEKLDHARRADYFTVLGVGRLCTPSEVREAADRLASEFAPDRFQSVREEGLPGRLEEILRVVGDAREVLADERLREEYLRGLGE